MIHYDAHWITLLIMSGLAYHPERTNQDYKDWGYESESLFVLTYIQYSTAELAAHDLILWLAITPLKMTLIKSMQCFEIFRKFSIWWTLRFFNLDKGELRKLNLKILTWSQKVQHLAELQPFWFSEVSRHLWPQFSLAFFDKS